LSNRFAKPGSNKGGGIDVLSGAARAPLLPTWLVCFECTVYACYAGGDHAIVVGEVVDLMNGSQQASGPLIFYGGRYRALHAEGGAGIGAYDLWLHGW
jgi:flavin reductase (DIM6/NTAB) family NADH-FMN oxidoreductase RutF